MVALPAAAVRHRLGLLTQQALTVLVGGRAMTTFSFILGLPMLHSTVAFSAVVSISTIGLYISCALPPVPLPECRALYQQPVAAAVSITPMPDLQDLLVIEDKLETFRV